MELDKFDTKMRNALFLWKFFKPEQKLKIKKFVLKLKNNFKKKNGKNNEK